MTTTMTSAPATRLLEVLRANADESGECRLPNRILAEQLSVKAFGDYGRRCTTVSRALKALEDAGAIDRRFEQGRRVLIVR
jgi:DNA-binding transcriptional ArsR family regulator